MTQPPRRTLRRRWGSLGSPLDIVKRNRPLGRRAGLKDRLAAVAAVVLRSSTVICSVAAFWATIAG